MNELEKQQFRTVILQALVARHPAAINTKAVMNRAAMEIDFDVKQSDVNSALLYLRDRNLVREVPSELGVSDTWQATAEGIQLIEKHNQALSRSKE